MNLKFNQAKEMLGNAGKTLKRITTKYYKVAGTAVVATSLCAVCSVSLMAQLNVDNTTGVMISLASAKNETSVFAGQTFETPGVTYADMQNVLYETDQLAALETSEKQIEEILSSNSQDRESQARVNALLAQDNKNQNVVSASTQNTSSYTPPETVVTFADENGTYECVGDFVLTAYCSCPICCGIYSNMECPTTASGTVATAGRTIAADTSVFPFGTKLVINGQVYTVEDRGGAIKGNRIDVYFNSHYDALCFGRQTATVYRVIE